jgi:hypothetical protein
MHTNISIYIKTKQDNTKTIQYSTIPKHRIALHRIASHRTTLYTYTCKTTDMRTYRHGPMKVCFVTWFLSIHCLNVWDGQCGYIANWDGRHFPTKLRRLPRTTMQSLVTLMPPRQSDSQEWCASYSFHMAFIWHSYGRRELWEQGCKGGTRIRACTLAL